MVEYRGTFGCVSSSNYQPDALGWSNTTRVLPQPLPREAAGTIARYEVIGRQSVIQCPAYGYEHDTAPASESGAERQGNTE